jgi:ParB-like chromosome segregation protein Spo0J
MGQYPGGVHPFANAFPMITGADFAELVESIEEHGLREKIIVTSDGTLIDGRNRWAALDAIGWQDYSSVTETLPEGTTEEDILELIVTRNLHRRHLTPSQKGMLGAELERQLAVITKRGQGSPNYRRAAVKGEPEPEPTKRHQETAAARAAKLTGASERYVETAKAVMKDAPDLADGIRSGDMTLNAARNEMKKRKTVEPSVPGEGPTSPKSGKRLPKRSTVAAVNSAMSTLNGLCIAISGAELDPDTPTGQRAEWFAELGKHIKTLSDFRRKLREED